MTIQVTGDEIYSSMSKGQEQILDGVLNQIFSKELKSKEEPPIVTKIHKILTGIFGEGARYVCRRLSEISRTTDNLPAIGFHIEENFNKDIFLNFLIRNMRVAQLAHPHYFSFYVKHENSREMVHTFKIEIPPINSEISELKDFPILKEIIK